MLFGVFLLSALQVATGLLPSQRLSCSVKKGVKRSVPIVQSQKNLNDDDGGYTVKQRLREEVDAPFRKVRLVLFGFSTVSATVALYFSLLTLGKTVANFGGTPPLEIATRDVGINVASVAVCALLSYREVKAGEKNLERIAKGGQLASLRVRPADNISPQTSLSSYRGKYRLLIAAGGEDFITTLATSVLEVDQKLADVSVRIIPILIEGRSVNVERGTRLWRQAQADHDSTISNSILDFPVLAAPWNDYLDSEIATATSQGFDPEQSGIGIYVKKNGRILRRATGQPNWDQFIGTMDVMDGNQFGRPRL